MTADLATQQRRHIADILMAYRMGYLDLVSAVDAIELDVFAEEPSARSGEPAERGILSALEG